MSKKYQNSYKKGKLIKEKQCFPLSEIQKRIWFLSYLEPNTYFYTVSDAKDFYGELNISDFKNSLRKILERHETLRTGFLEHKGDIYQYIKKG